MSQPYGPYAGPPAPGGWPPQPYGAPPRRPRPAVVWWTVAGCVMAAVLLALVTVAGYRMGSSELMDLPASAGSTSPPADWAVVGEDAGLDPYAQRCHDGEMLACDELYHLSDPRSDYEYYAMTCGGRVDARAVSMCVLLD